MEAESKCPFAGDARKHTVAGARSNADWWPDQLSLQGLNQHAPQSNPMGAAFDYATEFKGPPSQLRTSMSYLPAS
jgi:catalase-peroxidase